MALTVLLGGARSGKSSMAIELAKAADAPVVFLATARDHGTDPEWTARLAAHRQARPASWTTVEEPLDVAGALANAPVGSCIVVDCLTLWVANLLDRGDGDDEIATIATGAARTAAERRGITIAVSNEVGSGVVPFEPGVRRFRDVLGKVNAAWVTASHRAVLVVAGRVVPLAPAEALLHE
jgi:adenosylcobinamide kinase/adenosylcobinamide-phosphate guanylyltransferase